MKGIRFALIIVGVLGFLAWNQPAQAHVLKTDGTIGAVLHIDPDDDPIVGQPSTFFFEFKDKEKKFSPSTCACSAKIYQGDQELTSQPLRTTEGANPNAQSFTFAFPERAVYTVVVSGVPTADNAFQEFSLRYDLRVTRLAKAETRETSTGSSRTRELFLGATTVLTIGGFAYALRRLQSSPHQ